MHREFVYTVCMEITESEAAIVEHWGKSDHGFASAAEQLIQSLLWKFEVEAGRSSRSTDGLLPQYEKKTSARYFGTAVLAFLPDQSVEPLFLDFSLDFENAKLRSAIVRYGWSDWETTLYGDARHRKMSGILATMPKEDRNWLWTFVLLNGNWSAQRFENVRDPLLWPPL